MFPNEEAAKIAVGTVKEYKNETNRGIEVILVYNPQLETFIRVADAGSFNKENMVIQAWYPLGHGDKALIEESVFSKLAAKYGKSNAQIILR